MSGKKGEENIIFSNYGNLAAADILEHVNDGIYITDHEANTIYINHRYEMVSGLRRADVIGQNMKDMVSNGVISQSGTLAVLESGESVSMEQRFNTGRQAIITSTPIYWGEGEEKHIVLVLTVVNEITELNSLRRELERLHTMNQMYVSRIQKLQDELKGEDSFLAEDPESKRMRERVERAALIDDPVFVYGERGTGKERIASYIHRNSVRSPHPFLKIDFSALPENQTAAYLFGRIDPETKKYRPGILENAVGGTVYIKDISQMPAILRSRFLAMFQRRKCLLGDGLQHYLDIRFIVGSRMTVDELQAGGYVNEEMRNTLLVLQIPVKPLRERREDIVPLADYFLKQYNKQSGEGKYFSENCRHSMYNYDWPDNIEGLRIRVRRAAILNPQDEITTEDIFPEKTEQEQETEQLRIPDPQPDENGSIDLKMQVYRMEADYMTRAFHKFGNARLAAESLQMDSSTFVRKRQKYIRLGLMERRTRLPDGGTANETRERENT